MTEEALVPDHGVGGKDNSVSESDVKLIEELLTAGVPLGRVAELFRGRVHERELTRIARRLVAKLDSTTSSEDGPSALPELGMNILERSKSAALDPSFLKGHTANLAAEAPEELLDPLFFTLMVDPVVLSSGYVMDRSSALDEEGNLKFHACPFTRADLKEEVYPIISLKRKLQEFKQRRLQHMVETARRLLDEQSLDQFREVMSTAEHFLDDLGEETYIHLSMKVARMALEAHDLPCQEPNKSTKPADLARIYVRIHRAAPHVRHGFDEEISAKEEEEQTDFRQRIKGLEESAIKSIEELRFEQAEEWIGACETMKESCPGLLSHSTAWLRLQLAKNRGDTDLHSLRRSVFLEIHQDQSAVERFCQEEGICLDDLRDMRPVLLMRACIKNNLMSDEWCCAMESEPLEYKACRVMISVGRFQDQDWGNTKSKLGLALYDGTGTLVTRLNLFGTYRTPEYTGGKHPFRIIGEDEEIVKMAQPGFTYKLEYTVGGGGGHSVSVHAWFCKIFPTGWQDITTIVSHSLEDPTRNEGRYVGSADSDGKAHQKGELFYYDEKCVFFSGEFKHGDMSSGVLYRGMDVFCTMRDGDWSTPPDVDTEMVTMYPHDVSVKANLATEPEYESDGDY